jgi:hypothetical protein
MATAYTQPTQYKPYLKQWNTDLLAKALAYKQGSYDINREKVQQFYNQLSTLELAKEEDREYLENNLKILNQQVQEAGGLGDLSVAGSFDALASYYSQATDEKVENGYYGTLVGKKIRNEAEVAVKDGKYSDKNLSYSLQDYQKWVNDGQVGSEYNGASSYVPYTNITDKATKAIQGIVPEGYVEFDSMGNFSFYKKKGEKVTEASIISRLNSTVLNNAEVQSQMQVEGWDKFRGYDDKAFVNHISEIYDTQIEDYNNAINKLERAKLTTKKGDELEYIDNEISRISKAKQELLTNDNENSILKNRRNLEKILYENDFVSEIANSFKYNTVKDASIETDAGALAVWNEAQVNRRHQDNLNMEMTKMSETARLKNNEVWATALSDYQDPAKRESAIATWSAYGGSPLDLAKATAELTTVSPTTTGKENLDKNPNAVDVILEDNITKKHSALVQVEEEYNSMFSEKGGKYFGIQNTLNEYGRRGSSVKKVTERKERMEELFSYTDKQIDVMYEEGYIQVSKDRFYEIKKNYLKAKENYDMAHYLPDMVKNVASSSIDKDILNSSTSYPYNEKINGYVDKNIGTDFLLTKEKGVFTITSRGSLTKEGTKSPPLKNRQEVLQYLKENGKVDYKYVQEKTNDVFSNVSNMVVGTIETALLDLPDATKAEIINSLPVEEKKVIENAIKSTTGTDSSAPKYDYSKMQFYYGKDGKTTYEIEGGTEVKDINLERLPALKNMLQGKFNAQQDMIDYNTANNFYKMSPEIRTGNPIESRTMTEKEVVTVEGDKKYDLKTEIILKDKNDMTYIVKYTLQTKGEDPITRTDAIPRSLKDAEESRAKALSSREYINLFK